MDRSDWPPEVQQELTLARQARRQGQEGRARVCARRAAGAAARIYLEKHGIHRGSASVLDILSRLAEDPMLEAGIREAIETLQLRVDADFKLPEDVDLIAIAERLCQKLLT